MNLELPKGLDPKYDYRWVNVELVGVKELKGFELIQGQKRGDLVLMRKKKMILVPAPVPSPAVKSKGKKGKGG